MTSYLRPDERVTKGEIESAQERSGALKSAIGAVGTLGAGALSSKAIAKVLPFLSEYIPEDLAYKGINKVMPGLGTFLKGGMKQGLTLKSGLDFLRGEVEQKTKQESKQEPAKDKRNIIEQYAPELHKFISDEVSKGRQPIEAAALAQNDKRFSEIIKKLTKDHKTPWSSIIDSIYGTGQYGGAVNPPQAQQSKGQQQGNGKWDQIASSLQNLLKS